MKHIATIGSVLFASVLAVSADTEEQKKRLAQELRNIPVPELPAKAALIVRSTPAAERSQAAIIAVETIVARHPASASTVVAAIAKASPESAPQAASAATRLVPRESESIQAAAGSKNKGNDERGRKGSDEVGRGNGNQGNGNSNGSNNGNGNGNGNGNVDRPAHPGQPGRPEKSALLPNGKPRPFPHHGHTDDPNHVHKPNGPRPYNKPKPH